MILLFLSFLITFSPVNDKESSVRKKRNKTAPPGTVWIRDSLYIDKTEVRNLDYREYLFWLKKHSDSDSTVYKNALPDTLVWRDKLAYNEPYVEIYFRHPAYGNYPVVGISYELAVNYCNWRSDRVNEWIYIIVNKIKYSPDMKFEAPVPQYVKYRLPNKEEWEFAARGGLKDADYPWGGYFIEDFKGKNQAGYYRIGEEQIFYNDSLQKFEIVNSSPDKPFRIEDTYDVPCSVASYPPNGYGIYDISGNVYEIIAEKGITKGGSYKYPGYHLRIAVDGKYTKPTNDIGFRCVCEKLIDY